MRKKLFVVGVLSLLSIFQSCNNGEEISNEKNSSVEKTASSYSSRLTSDSKTLSGYVTNILATQTEIKSILDSENNANFAMIQSGMQNVKTVEDLELLYRNANVTHIEELISLYESMGNNSEIFINNNPDFYSNYTEKNRSELIINEIDIQLGYTEGDLQARTNCHNNYVKGNKRCLRNFAITMTGVAVSGFFSFGVSTVVGGAVGTIMLQACVHDTEIDYSDCVKDGGTP